MYSLRCSYYTKEFATVILPQSREFPVDEQFYNESEIGKELGEGSRAFSFGHSGDIKVTGKRIQE